MRIDRILAGKTPSLSLEVFPPKPNLPIEGVYDTLENLSNLNPAFISVTYGAGGDGSARTLEIASALRNRFDREPLMHFTCMGIARDDLDRALLAMMEEGVGNVMALRGDPPRGGSDGAECARGDFQYASDLIAAIKARSDVCVGAAAYPEAHPFSPTIAADREVLKLKMDAGADFFVTQMCFDNRAVLEFLNAARGMGVDRPILIGVMPVLDARQILRMTQLAGCSIPANLSRILARYVDDPDSLYEAGLEFACEQIRDLVQNGVDGIHLYSMNRARPTCYIVESCGLDR